MSIRNTIKLATATTKDSIRFISEAVTLSASAKTTSVTVTRTGTFTDPRYGTFDITLAMLQQMVRNFESNTYGQEIALDLSHDPSGGAAGFFRSLSIEPYSFVIEGETKRGHKLIGDVELTQYGVDAITKKGFIYLSAEFHPEFVSNETGKQYGALLQGAALTPRPVVKHLDKVSLQLSSSSIHNDNPTLIDSQLAATLHEENTMKWAQILAALKSKLASLKLSEPIAKQLIALAESLLKTTDDEAKAKALAASIESSAVQLSEADLGTSTTIQLDTSELEKILKDSQSPPGDVKALSENDVSRILENHLKAQADAQDNQARKLAANIKVFDTAVQAAEGLEDSDRKSLSEAHDLITAEMTEDQIKRFAEREITNAQKLIAERKLHAMGATVQGPAGVVQLSHYAGAESQQLQAMQHEQLKKTSKYRNGDLRLSETLHPFVEDTLALFDTINAQKIHHAVRSLADGQTNISDTDLPVGYQREVIREALSDLNILMIVSATTDPTATATTQIPYELRDVDSVLNDGIVPERGPIHKAGVTQAMDLAYINAMKIAIDVSNEVMHFTRTSGINWDAWARNIASAARLMRELLQRRIANMLQRQADAFNAVDVSNESIQAQVDGSGGIVKTTQFPIVEPHQVRDLQGNAVGTAQNAIVVRVNGATIPAYDGSGTQSAGTYYQIVNHNLGYIQFVDENGAAATPNHSSGNTDISYSYATNILKVDADLPADTKLETHLNKLLQAFGTVKATMSSQRFVKPDFSLMSASLHNEITNAELFSANAKRNDADINSQGDLGPVKGIPGYETNAPNIHLGDERIILGQRGVASYTIAKPWSMGDMVEARNSNGQLIGAKECYGEEYNALHVPAPLRNRFMSVLWYSATNR